jgi:hypothetical protein
MNEHHKPRRAFLKLSGAALAAAPLLVSSRWAAAEKNAAMRAALKYQDTPDGEKMCSNCIHFVPGKTATEPGGCKLFAGDTEVAPKGYCTAWMKTA